MAADEARGERDLAGASLQTEIKAAINPLFQKLDLAVRSLAANKTNIASLDLNEQVHELLVGFRAEEAQLHDRIDEIFYAHRHPVDVHALKSPHGPSEFTNFHESTSLFVHRTSTVWSFGRPFRGWDDMELEFSPWELLHEVDTVAHDEVPSGLDILAWLSVCSEQARAETLRPSSSTSAAVPGVDQDALLSHDSALAAETVSTPRQRGRRRHRVCRPCGVAGHESEQDEADEDDEDEDHEDHEDHEDEDRSRDAALAQARREKRPATMSLSPASEHPLAGDTTSGLAPAPGNSAHAQPVSQELCGSSSGLRLHEPGASNQDPTLDRSAAPVITYEESSEMSWR